MKLTLRQQKIVEKIPQCDTLIDVGCDHGKISYYALENKLAKKVICTDISKPSLEKAKKLIFAKYPESEFIVADGIPQDCKFDFTVIAGMGGIEIIKILQNGEPKKVLCQPMNNLTFFREEVINLGYKIKYDELFFDKKFYNLILIEKGNDRLNKSEIIFGRDNLKNRGEDFLKYLQNERNKAEKIMSGLLVNCERRKELAEYLEEIKGVLNDN